MISKRLCIVLIFVVYFLGMYTGYSYHDAIDAKIMIEKDYDRIIRQQNALNDAYRNHTINITDSVPLIGNEQI